MTNNETKREQEKKKGYWEMGMRGEEAAIFLLGLNREKGLLLIGTCSAERSNIKYLPVFLFV